MSEKIKRIEFISEEPKIANILARRKPTILSETTYDWFVSWVYDVGSVMRSREYKVSMVANYVGYMVLLGLVHFTPFGTLIEKMPFVKKVLRV